MRDADTIIESSPSCLRNLESAPLQNSNPTLSFKDMLASNTPHIQGLMPYHNAELEDDETECSDDENLDPNVEEDP